VGRKHGAFGTRLNNMTTLKLTDKQAKILLILTGNMAGNHGSCGIFEMLCTDLNVDRYTVPDVRIGPNESILIDDWMIENIKHFP
jgi:hypothetical protein